MMMVLFCVCVYEKKLESETSEHTLDMAHTLA